MKRIIILLVGILFIFSSNAIVFAAESQPAGNASAVTAPATPAAPAETAPAPVKKTLHKTRATHSRITHMRTYGKVLEVTDTNIRIERKVKGIAEAMEFTLEKPVKVKVGQMVKIRYIEKEGKNVVVKVVRAGSRQARAKKAK